MINRYIVSNTPPNVASADTKHGNAKPLKTRWHFVMDAMVDEVTMLIGKGKIEAPNVMQTLPIELDQHAVFLSRPQVREENGRFIGDGVSEGYIEPCWMEMRFNNSETNEFANFKIMNNGPITVGEYELFNVKDVPDGTYTPERLHPGMVMGQYGTPGAGNQPNDPDSRTYKATAGTLTIESISGPFMTGHVVAYGSTDYPQRLD